MGLNFNCTLYRRACVCIAAAMRQSRRLAALAVFLAGAALSPAAGTAGEPSAPLGPEVAPETAARDGGGQVPFSAESVEQAARDLAARPYEDPDKQLPEYLRSLTKEQWDSLRRGSGAVLWSEPSLPFEAELRPPGFIYNRVVAVNVVEDGKSRRLSCPPGMFETPDESLAEKLKATPPGFAGFDLRHRFEGPDGARAVEDIANFIGASYFQAVGKNALRGVSARGIALDTALPDGEEFPYFREFWLQAPRPGDETFVLHALMDSPSLSGAFRMEIASGASAVMNVDAKFFLRRGAKRPAKIGLAPLTSMFLFSETGNGRPGDYRPEVHNSDGLLYAAADGGWVWSPLVNPGRLMVNRFPTANPRGFGLMQRDAAFDHYQDLSARFDRRGSVWVEPLGDWGQGHIELVELPGTSEYNGNITAFWVPEVKTGQPAPAAPAGAGEAAAAEAPAAPFRAVSYRLYWLTPGSSLHDLGRAVDTRMVKSPDNTSVTFMVDFSGEALNAIPPDTGLASVVEAPEQAPLLEKRLEKNPATGSWRLTLKFRLPQAGMVESLLAVRGGPPHLRFGAFLKRGENLPDPLTETWVFDMTP